MHAPKPKAEIHTPIHPAADNITELLSFRLARLVAVNEQAGNQWTSTVYNLRLNEWRVLGLTRALEPVGFQEITRRLMMDKGQLSRIVKALVNRGVISASPSREDRRTVILSTTPQGRDLHDRVLPFAQQRNEAVVGSLTPAEYAEFSRILQKITDHNEHLLETRSRCP